MVEPGVRDVAEAWPDVAIADLPDVSQLSGSGAPVPRRAHEPGLPPRAPRKSHRKQRFAIFRVLQRVWIPLVIAVVIGAGGLTVARLHGIFGAEKGSLYANAQSNDTKRFDPQRLTYEVYGPPGTVATISYFDADANPQRVIGAPLPWSVTFATTGSTAVQSLAAQGNSDSIGCRILVDGVVKVDQTAHHEASAFISCKPKDA